MNLKKDIFSDEKVPRNTTKSHHMTNHTPEIYWEGKSRRAAASAWVRTAELSRTQDCLYRVS